MSRAPAGGLTSSAVARQYHSSFGSWYERASVRRSAHHLLAGDDLDRLFFPPELVPVTAHPLVAARGSAAIRAILIGRLYQYLTFTVDLETSTVVPVTTAIAQGRSGLDVPAQMRQDAFKIATDEAWHAQFSDDMVEQVAAGTGVTRPAGPRPAFANRVAAIRAGTDHGLSALLDLVLAIVSETVISAILSGVPRDHRLPQAVRKTVADHAEDEGRHHAYFRSVLSLLWPMLTPDQRCQIGPLIPRMIWAFLEPDYQAERTSLVTAGLTRSQAEQALAESYRPADVSRSVADTARATVRYFREAGALDDLRTREEFTACGLLPSPDDR
jgi:hypothetical protein